MLSFAQDRHEDVVYVGLHRNNCQNLKMSDVASFYEKILPAVIFPVKHNGKNFVFKDCYNHSENDS